MDSEPLGNLSRGVHNAVKLQELTCAVMSHYGKVNRGMMAASIKCAGHMAIHAYISCAFIFQDQVS